ncbi:hypothetical protein [Flaviaesturariibacter terrae]
MRFFDLRTNKSLLLFLLLLLAGSGAAHAQDTLPRFTVRDARNNRIIVSWVNPFPNIAQLTIQRGFDSIGPFKTILTVADAKSVQNGFTDTKAPNDHMWYRLFYAMEGGSYFFTKAKRPDTSRVALPPAAQRPPSVPGVVVPKDSVQGLPRDSARSVPRDSVRVKPPVVRKPEWVPSVFVFTNNEGYVQLRLPDAADKNYSVKFFEDNTLLFEIRNVKEKLILFDKSNFYHSGWFFFELYNDDKLVERNKFYLRP